MKALPEGWSLRPLRELASVQRGRFSARPRNDPQYFGGDVPFVQTGDVAKAGLFLENFSQTLNAQGVAVSKVFPADTLLLTIAATIGETAITRFPVACPDSVVAIQPHAAMADLVWLRYALAAQQPHLDARAGQNAQKNINLQLLAPLEIPTPPLPEQRRIGEVLRTWDRAIDIGARLLENSRRQRSALSAILLSGPWESLRLGDAATFRNGLNFTAADEGEAIKIVGVSDFKHHAQLASTDGLATIRASRTVRDQDLLASGDLLFVRSNGNKALVGRCLYFPQVSERLAFSGFTIRGRVDAQVLLPSFASHLMRSEPVRRQLRLAGDGTNISNLSQEALAETTVPVPPLAEQAHIARVLDACDRESSVFERLIANCRQQKQLLLQDLLTGARRVPAQASRRSLA